MAKRLCGICRVDTTEVQGEGSWAEVSQLTVRQMRAGRQRGKEKDFDAFEFGVDTLKEHVLRWNWVDDEGIPYPQPEDEPDIIEVLCDKETALLGKAVQGSAAEAKN